MSRTPKLVLSLASAWFVVSAAEARAGNQDSVFLGSQAAMSAGAVTAVSRDGEAAWYNPAGLGSASLNSIDASASAFVLRMRKIPGLLETVLSDAERQSIGLSSVEILSIPTALVYTRAFSEDLWVGLGVFVPEQDQLRLSETDESTLSAEGGGEIRYRQTVRLEGEESAYFIGPSVGWKLLDSGLRFGGSLFVVYSTVAQVLQAWTDIGVQDPTIDARGFGMTDERYSVSRIGLQGVFGAQLELPEWAFGAVLRTPIFLIAEWGEYSTLDQASSAGIPGELGSVDVEDSEQDISEYGFRVATPARLYLGAAYRFSGGWVSVDFDLAHPLEGDADLGTDDTTWNWNVRAGARFALSPQFTMGLGFFTDRSPFPSPGDTDTGAERVDYYGGTLGLEYRKRYAVTGEEDGDALVFASTFALRYAAGVGTFIGSTIRPFDDAAADPQGRPIDLLYHELALHIGSALYF